MTDLYDALVQYEEVANNVGVQTITTQGAYRQLTDAIGGHGDLLEARARFALEFPILAAMHEEWKAAALEVSAAVAESVSRSNPFADAYPGLLSERPWRPE